MLVDDIIANLRYGELSNHGMFLNEDLAESDKVRLIHHINVGLTELYTRFPLFTRELTLIQLEGKTIYNLKSEYTYQAGTAPDFEHYILDSRDYPFDDDLIRVTAVYDEGGKERRINDSTASCVVTFPAPDIIEIPEPIHLEALFLIYQANHYKLDSLSHEVMLPANMLPALLAYVAYRVYTGCTGQEHAMLANSMYQKYELFCTQQLHYGTDNSIDMERNIKPCLGGWI